jgi:hypothetical protein
VASGRKTASSSKMGPVYIYSYPFLLRQREDKFIHVDIRPDSMVLRLHRWQAGSTRLSASLVVASALSHSLLACCWVVITLQTTDTNASRSYAALKKRGLSLILATIVVIMLVRCHRTGISVSHILVRRRTTRISTLPLLLHHVTWRRFYSGQLRPTHPAHHFVAESKEIVNL